MNGGGALDLWLGRKLRQGPPIGRAALERHQLQCLRETLRWARERSPFYRQLQATELAELGAIARLPFTTAEDLAADPLRLLAVSQSEVNRVVTLHTSGTTASPKRLFFDAADQQATRDFFVAGLSQMAACGDRVLVLLPRGHPGGLGDLLAAALRALGTIPVFAGDGPLAVAAARVTRQPLGLVIGAPVPVLALCRLAGRASVRRVLLCSDSVPAPIVRALQDRWGCEVFRDWGMTEMGYGGGVECRLHRGYHLQEADFLFEIIDPESGAPVAEGQMGEVVLTTLARRAMPLIRYRTGDISRFLPGPCPCGSPLRRLDGIHTRRGTEIVPGGGDAVMLAELDEALFGVDGMIDFRIGFSPGHSARLLVEASALPGPSGWEAAFEGAIRDSLDGIGAIEGARRIGRLSVDVRVVPGAVVFSPGKRVIGREPPQ